MKSQLRKWQQINTRQCCKNSWIRVREDVVKLPDGKELDSFIVVEYCGAVGILAIEESRILLVRQYRYAIDKFTWEIPAGALLGKDRIEESARSELLEEAGFTASSISRFYGYYPSPGSSNEVIHLVVAKRLEKSREQNDKPKLFQVKWVGLDEVLPMISGGEISHSPTIVAVLIGRERGLFN